MKGPAVRSQTKIGVAYQEIMKFKEESEMKLTMRITKVKGQLSEVLATQHPAKLLGGLALGALLLTVTGMHFLPNNADEVSPPPAIQQLVDHDYEDDIVLTGSLPSIGTATVDREFGPEAIAAHPDLEIELEWYLTFGNDYPLSIVDNKSDFAAIAAHPDLENELEWYLTFGNDYPVSIVDTKPDFHYTVSIADTKPDFAATAPIRTWETSWNGTSPSVATIRCQ